MPKNAQNLSNDTLQIIFSIFEDLGIEKKGEQDSFTPQELTFVVQEGEHKGKSPLWCLARMAARGKPEAFLEVYSQYQPTFKAEDFTMQAKEGLYKGMSILYLLVAFAVKGHPGAFLEVYKQHKAAFKAEDFTNQAQEGPSKGISPLWLLAQMAANGKPEVFLEVYSQYKEEFKAEAFMAQAQEGAYKGTSVLWFLAEAAAMGKREVFLEVYSQYKEEFKAEAFMVQAQEGPYKGTSVLWLLALSVENGNPDIFMEVFNQHKMAIKAEDWTAQAQEGPFKGKSALWHLAHSGAFCDAEAFLAVYQKHKLEWKVEDWTAQAQEGPDMGTSILWLLALSVTDGNPDIFMEVFNQHKMAIKAEDFASQAQSGLGKGKSPLWFLAQAAALGKPEAFLDVYKQHKSAFKAEDWTAQAQEGFDKGLCAFDFFSRFVRNGEPKIVQIIIPEFIATHQMIGFRNTEKREIENTIGPNTILGGVANKYLRPENRTGLNPPKALPFPPQSPVKKLNHGKIGIIKSVSLENYSLQALPVTTLRHCIELQPAKNCKFAFYSYDTQVNQDMPCVFIMAGRKNQAHFFTPQKGIRTILVFSKPDLNELTHPVPAALDYLVIDQMESSTHGKFNENELGLLTPRRMAAFLFTYHYQVKHCIVCDDNIESITLNNKIGFGTTEFYLTMIEQLGGNLSVNIQTISNKSNNDEQKNKLGSKIFAFNMQALRAFFKQPEHLFYLLPPSSCVRWWGEDYLMQCMLSELGDLVSVQGFKTLSKHDFGGLTRLTQYRNSCQKVISTAEDYIEKDNIFMSGIDFDQIEPYFEKAIINSFNHIKKIVEHRIKLAVEKKKRLANLNIEEAHALANNIVSENMGDAKSILPVTFSIKQAMAEAQKDLKQIEQLVYLHQYQALEKLFSMSPSTQNVHLNLCTGAGKTRIQIAFAHLLAKKVEKPVFIIAPTIDLVQQTYNEFIQTQQIYSSHLKDALNKQEIIKVSSTQTDLSQKLLSPNHKKNSNVFIFCEDSFKLFMTSERYFNPCAFLFDEYHDIAKETIQRALEKIPQKDFLPVIGFSATPDLKKHPSLKNELFVYAREDALRDGRVTPIITDRFNQGYSNTLYRKLLANMHTMLQTHIHPNGKLLCKNKGIIYVNSIEDANYLGALIAEKLEIKTYPIHSQSPGDFINRFKESDIAVAIAVRKLRVGFDEPSMNYVICLQNPKNENIFTQMVGRVMRTTSSDSKKTGYVITYPDANTNNLKVTTDKVAFNIISELYLLKQRAINELRSGVSLLKKGLKNFRTILVEKKKEEILETLIEHKGLNEALDKIDNESYKFYTDYKKAIKPDLTEKEYRTFKKKDQLFLLLKKLNKELIPINLDIIYYRDLYERDLLSLDRDKEKAIDFQELYELIEKTDVKKEKRNFLVNKNLQVMYDLVDAVQGFQREDKDISLNEEFRQDIKNKSKL